MIARGALHLLDLRSRCRAAGIHLIISLAVAALAAMLVFGLWFPGIYQHLSGGRELFMLIVVVDVVLGPLLTFVAFDLRKGWPHVRRDLGIIGGIQMAALIYGLHTVYIARPVAMVFEADRFRVVIAHDVHRPDLPKASLEYQKLPITGPWLLGTRPTRPGDERNEAIFLALDGIDIGMRPNFWVPYEQSRSAVQKAARPLAELLKRYPERAESIRARLADKGGDERETFFIPILARNDWVALLRADSSIIEFEKVDGWF